MTNKNTKKVCHLDVETTGTDPKTHGIIQVAMIVEVGEDAHDAMADIMATRELVHQLSRRYLNDCRRCQYVMDANADANAEVGGPAQEHQGDLRSA